MEDSYHINPPNQQPPNNGNNTSHVLYASQTSHRGHVNHVVIAYQTEHNQVHSGQARFQTMTNQN